MTKLNCALTALLLVCILVPGISIASGAVSDASFGGLFLKMIVPISAFILLNDIVAIMWRKKC
jgi:hypothetical protein